MLNCRPHRAAGPDLIPPELCKFACRWMAYHLGPLVLKCSLYQSEPLAWKGGVLHEIYKQRGKTTHADSYRGILVKSADPLQLGGRPHMGVNMATHTLKMFLAVAKEDTRSTCVFYLDIKSAYYRLLRSLSIGQTCTTPELMKIFATMGLPADTMHELIVKANEISALEETGCPDWLRGYAVAYHQHTWYHVRDDPAVTMTLRGTRPGDGYADLLFSLVVGRLLRQLEAELVAEGLQTTVAWNGERNIDASPGQDVTCSAFNIVWADDVAVLLQHPDANTLLQQSKYVMGRYVDYFAAHGLLLNFDKGKSECMLNLRGCGPRKLNRDIFQAANPQVTLDTASFGDISLRIVRQYKHLGNVIHASGHCLPEMRSRVGAANTAFNAHRRSIYQNTKLSLERRVQVFQACVLSILYWNVETWTLVRPCEERYFTGAVNRLLKRLLHKDVPIDLLHHWPAHRVHAVLGLPDVNVMLKRLSYYGSLVRFGPNPLWWLRNDIGSQLSNRTFAGFLKIARVRSFDLLRFPRWTGLLEILATDPTRGMERITQKGQATCNQTGQDPQWSRHVQPPHGSSHEGLSPGTGTIIWCTSSLPATGPCLPALPPNFQHQGSMGSPQFQMPWTLCASPLCSRPITLRHLHAYLPQQLPAVPTFKIQQPLHASPSTTWTSCCPSSWTWKSPMATGRAIHSVPLPPCWRPHAPCWTCTPNGFGHVSTRDWSLGGPCALGEWLLRTISTARDNWQDVDRYSWCPLPTSCWLWRDATGPWHLEHFAACTISSWSTSTASTCSLLALGSSHQQGQIVSTLALPWSDPLPYTCCCDSRWGGNSSSHPGGQRQMCDGTRLRTMYSPTCVHTFL